MKNLKAAALRYHFAGKQDRQWLLTQLEPQEKQLLLDAYRQLQAITDLSVLTEADARAFLHGATSETLPTGGIGNAASDPQGDAYQHDATVDWSTLDGLDADLAFVIALAQGEDAARTYIKGGERNLSLGSKACLAASRQQTDSMKQLLTDTFLPGH